MVMPVVLDSGSVNLFDGEGAPRKLRLADCERLSGGFVWLRYEVAKDR
jgi:hypothetical protein